jgi:sulfite exporter TauE/SafE
MLDHPTHLALAADAGFWGVALTLFLAGLAGSFVHCAAMCGPFVIAQTVARFDAAPLHRLAGFALLPYHLGRATSYVALGAILGAVGGMVANLPGARFLLAGALAAAGLLFASQALGYGRANGGSAAGAWLAVRVRPLLEAPSGTRGYALGLALGFLPCGFLYGALAAAAGTGSAAAGAFAMAGFVAGTAPALLVVGIAGAMAAKRWKNAVAGAAPALMLFNAAGLLWLAWRALARS